jgi:hypothetical protein
MSRSIYTAVAKRTTGIDNYTRPSIPTVIPSVRFFRTSRAQQQSLLATIGQPSFR